MTTVAETVDRVLTNVLSEITRSSVIGRLGGLGTKDVLSLAFDERAAVLSQLEVAVKLFARGDKEEISRRVEMAIPSPGGQPDGLGSGKAPPRDTKVVIDIRDEDDITTARGQAWSSAVELGFSRFSAVKVATAVSELTRNIVFYAGSGSITLETEHAPGNALLRLTARDGGPGISQQKLAALRDGTYRSQRGMGQGLEAVRRLADSFELETTVGKGTTVTCTFRLSP